MTGLALLPSQAPESRGAPASPTVLLGSGAQSREESQVLRTQFVVNAHSPSSGPADRFSETVWGGVAVRRTASSSPYEAAVAPSCRRARR